MARLFEVNKDDTGSPMQRSFERGEDDMQLPRFSIDVEISRQYRRFNSVGQQLTVRLLPPYARDSSNPMSHFLASVTDLFEYALRNCDDSDMVGITISNEVNVHDKAVGISFGRKDQINSNVIWSGFEKVAQSNARFNALDKLVVNVHSVIMPIGQAESLQRVDLLRPWSI
jgi:hypothetical protein